MIFFDLDGTLIDSNNVWLQIDLDFLAQRHLPYTKAYSDYVSHATYQDAAAYTKSCFGLSESVDEIVQIWSDMACEAYANTIPLKPFVWDFLTLQQAKGEPMGIVTSCMDHLCHAVLKRTGIDRFFSSITTVRESKKGKQNPDLFLLAARKAGMAPPSCMVFEDSPVACESARKTGMQVIGVYDPFFAEYGQEMQRICHQYIHSFQELL